jgi:sugar phosphate permease
LVGTIAGVLALGLATEGENWRWGFVGLGFFSVLSGILIWLLADEPPRGAAEPELEN